MKTFLRSLFINSSYKTLGGDKAYAKPSPIVVKSALNNLEEMATQSSNSSQWSLDSNDSWETRPSGDSATLDSDSECESDVLGDCATFDSDSKCEPVKGTTATETSWGVTDVRDPAKVKNCRNQMNTNFHKLMYKDTLIAWDKAHGKKEPTEFQRDLKGFFALDFYRFGPTFKALDKSPESDWYLADLFEMSLNRHNKEISTGEWTKARISFIEGKDDTVVKELHNICDLPDKTDAEKMELCERYLFSQDPVGRSVVRALARVGFEIVPKSLRFGQRVNDLYHSPTKYIIIKGKLSTDFRIRPIGSVVAH